ncbi:hypothetical protein DNTS_024364, partial [Danionella cerebrum]
FQQHRTGDWRLHEPSLVFRDPDDKQKEFGEECGFAGCIHLSFVPQTTLHENFTWRFYRTSGVIFISSFMLVLNFAGSFPVTKKISGYVGDSVVFSCNITKSDINVKWRDSKDLILDVSPDQSEKYKDRVALQEDNCSIRLINLQKSDEGRYSCYVPDPTNKELEFDLVVLDKPEGSGNQGKQDENGSPSAAPSHHCFSTKIKTIIIIIIIIFIIIIIMCCMFRIFFIVKLIFIYLQLKTAH